jgi:hypothetical protein
VHLDLRRAELAQQPKVAAVSASALSAAGPAGRE